MAKSGYFESKKVRSETKMIRNRVYALDHHMDEAATFTTDSLGACWVRFNLFRARPGRRVRFVLGACACAICITPAACEQITTTAGGILAMDVSLTSIVANARLDLVCEAEGIWAVENHVAAWVQSTR